MEEFITDLSVIDVYDIASDIGKEFETIIDTCGPDVVTNLMPKVINALEHLESLATKSERENVILEDLRTRVLKLENEKHVKAEDRVKFEKELEQIEEDWRKESNHLLNVVAQLQEENKRLTTLIADKSFYDLNDTPAAPELDVKIIHQLQNQLDQLREKLKLQNVELDNKNSAIDNLENQVEHLNGTLKDLRRKQRVHQGQIHSLIEERADYLMQVQDQQREIMILRQRLGIAQNENEDLVKSHEDIPDLKNKVIYDSDDPNRPRFTVQELKEILYERNELKARLNELQDELAVYKPVLDIDSQDDNETVERHRRYDADVHLAMCVSNGADPKNPQNIVSFFPQNVPTNTKSEEAVAENIEEGPVQGPLPMEPDDAPWRRSESGIRKFFRKLFTNRVVIISPKHKFY